MAARNRPGSAKQALAQQAAGFRRGAPGKRYVGETSDQSARAKASERKRVARMAEIDSARRRAEEVGEPVSAVLAELVQEVVRVAWTLASAPFRIVAAVRRAREA
jgi:hypothetical protein